MPKNEPDKDDAIPVRRQDSTSVIQLGQFGEVDLSCLPESEQTQIKKKLAEGQIDMLQLAQELGVHNQALDRRLCDIGDRVAQATEVEASATITGSYEDKMGRTEVIIGNTDTAAKGKLDRSQKGERDQTIIYVVIAAIVVVILAAITVGQ